MRSTRQRRRKQDAIITAPPHLETAPLLQQHCEEGKPEKVNESHTPSPHPVSYHRHRQTDRLSCSLRLPCVKLKAASTFSSLFQRGTGLRTNQTAALSNFYNNKVFLKRKNLVRGDYSKRIHACTHTHTHTCLLYTSPSPRDRLVSRMPSSA